VPCIYYARGRCAFIPPEEWRERAHALAPLCLGDHRACPLYLKYAGLSERMRQGAVLR
jgi:hypothetical protein